MATRRARSRTTLKCGPWKGVFNTNDPFDASADLLVDLKNCYIPDATNGSGVYARPGFLLQNGALPLATGFVPVAGQGMHKHTMLDGSTINFMVVGGRLLRDSGGFGTYVDVTPVGISIDTDPLTQVYFVSLVGNLFVNDGVARPWVGTNLTSTPITGAYVDYDGAGVSWTAFGQPVVKDGAVVVILNAVGGVSRRADIAWSSPGDATTGWQQATFDYNWTLSTNDADAIYALCATNLALIYFRDESIGAASGTVGPDFASTATNDSVSFNVGTRTCRGIQKYGDSVFFVDSQGRPYRYRPGNPPESIWKQMRGVVEAARTDAVSATDLTVLSAVIHTLNLYAVAIWSPTPSTNARPIEMYLFDAATATYNGRWTIFDYGTGVPASSQGIDLQSMGVLADANGLDTLCVIGTLSGTDPDQIGGYLWTLMGPHDSHSGRWEDNAIPPDRIATTDRLGYSEDVVYNVDRVTVVTGSVSPVAVRITTPNDDNVLQATPDVDGNSQDGTYRLVAGCNVQGRGPSVSVSPTEATAEQWVLQRIALSAVPSTAHPEDG